MYLPWYSKKFEKKFRQWKIWKRKTIKTKILIEATSSLQGILRRKKRFKSLSYCTQYVDMLRKIVFAIKNVDKYSKG